MKLGTRIIPTLAVAFFLVPTLFADDTAKPANIPNKDEPVNSTATAGEPAKPKRAGKTLLALPAGPSRQTPAGGGSGKHSERHGHRSRGHGDSTPKVELFMGYSYWRALPKDAGNRIEAMHGGSASLAFNLSRHVGLVFDVGGSKVDSLQFTNHGAAFTPSRVVDAEGNVFTVMLGPRISWRDHDRFTPFLQVLGGMARADEVTLNACNVPILACIPLPTETTFAMTAGGGLDYKLNHRLALRLFQAEYLLTRFRDPTSLTGDHGWQGNMRLSAGIVLRFGGDSTPPPPPNSSPRASCSIDKNVVYAGSGEMAEVRANASDPDNDSLTYSWTANDGTVEGSGPEARWNSSGTNPGTYTVKVRVDDGRGGTADCSAEIRVEPQPNRAPTMSCSADHNSVVIGEAVLINANASDPDNDSLTYSWKSSGGRVRGTGASARFDTSGLKAGRYSVSGHVDDSRGGAADCQVGVEAHEPPPPPEMVELERRLDLHSIYFQTARPTTANPNGGLVPSQENILAVLADDFKKYLKYRPDSHLILGGHADERGSEEYNKRLTERRVERTRNYLIGHGVLATAIETRSFGKEDQLNAEQIKEQIAANPDLTPDDRRQMLVNLNVMVLANNRRVDVALSTTGQQSTRRYPFNARDYLALISTKGGEKEPRVIKRKPKR